MKKDLVKVCTFFQYFNYCNFKNKYLPLERKKERKKEMDEVMTKNLKAKKERKKE